jgi:hypothetical protein
MSVFIKNISNRLKY